MKKSLVLVLIAVLVACSSSSKTATISSPAAGPEFLTGSIGAATYTIEVPHPWNGTLFLYSHGYVSPGGTSNAAAAPDGPTGQWLLDGGYALAASSYSSSGWAIEDALKDQVALLDHFAAQVGKPKRVIAWGASLGGIITAGLIQQYPDRFAAAVPICGVLAGAVASWNTGLDGAYAFKMLLAPHSQLQLVHITNPDSNLLLANDAMTQVSDTPAGRARIALIAALTGLPGWFVPTSPEPAAADYVAREAAQAQWASRVDFPFEFRNRAELEKRAGGNPSWNVGIDYAHQLSRSADRPEVVALYRAASLDLNADLRTLNAGATIRPDPAALAYLDRNVSFDGRIAVPVLTMHTTGDGLVVPEDETAYADLVRRAGDASLLRQVFVHRAGHCAFTSAEIIAAFKVVLNRLETGAWDARSLVPSALNASALTLGPGTNSLGGVIASAPAFTAYSPGPYPRPFPKGSSAPG